MSNSVDNNNVSNVLQMLQSSIISGPGGSIQLEFAKLQLALAEFSKLAAQEQMKVIEEAQAEQARVSALLQEARQLQSDAKDDKNYMPAEMAQYMSDNDLSFHKKDEIMEDIQSGSNKEKYSDEDWEVAIASLQAHLDQIGTNTQQIMVLINDYMGQYNSYLQGASTSISQATQTTQSISNK